MVNRYFSGMLVGIRHLRYFVAVAEELSFTAAARSLHISQPPLSMQIRQLEAELGVELIDRSRRAISLTAAGEALLAEARPLLLQFDQTLRIATRAGDGEVGRLTIGFVPSAINGRLPQVLLRFRTRYPAVELLLREMRPDHLVDDLADGSLDISFFFLPFTDPRFVIRAVSREPLVVALPADHPLAAAPSLPVARLAPEPFVLPARHRMPGLHALVVETCLDAGFEPRAVQQDVWQLQTVLGLVAAGMGIALLPLSVESTRQSGVVFRPLTDAKTTVSLGAIWRRARTTAALRNFTSLLPSVD
jgi:DNA-binding transcriptional LysR family regulator